MLDEARVLRHARERAEEPAVAQLALRNVRRLDPTLEQKRVRVLW